jgi:hypothetical protein
MATAWPQVRNGDIRVVEHSQNAEPVRLRGPPLGAGTDGDRSPQDLVADSQSQATPFGADRQLSTFITGVQICSTSSALPPFTSVSDRTVVVEWANAE